jgi:hypothetical protein
VRWPWRKPTALRADPLRIAVLEYELLGIEPEPGTAAAHAVKLHTFQKHASEKRGVIEPPSDYPRIEVLTIDAIRQRYAATSRWSLRPGSRIGIALPDPCAADAEHRDPRR